MNPQTLSRKEIYARTTKTDIVKTVVKIALIATIILPLAAHLFNDRIEQRSFHLFKTEYQDLDREDRKKLIKNLFSKYWCGLEAILQDTEQPKLKKSLQDSYYLAYDPFHPFHLFGPYKKAVKLMRAVEANLKELLSEINDDSTYFCVVEAALKVKGDEFKSTYELMNEDTRIKFYDLLLCQWAYSKVKKHFSNNLLDTVIDLVKNEKNPEEIIKKLRKARARTTFKGIKEIIRKLLKQKDYKTFSLFYQSLDTQQQKKQIKQYFENKELRPILSELLEITKAPFEHPDFYLKCLHTFQVPLLPDSPNYNFIHLLRNIHEDFYAASKFSWVFHPSDKESRFIKDLPLTSILKVEDGVIRTELLRIWDVYSRPKEDLYKEFVKLTQLDEALLKEAIKLLTADEEKEKKFREKFFNAWGHTPQERQNHSKASSSQNKSESNRSSHSHFSSGKRSTLTKEEKEKQNEWLKVLGLSTSIAHDKEALNEAFKELRFKYHPDKNADKAWAEKKFKELYNAYTDLVALLERYHLEMSVV